MGEHRRSPRWRQPAPTIPSASASGWLFALGVVGASTIIGLRVEHGPVGVLVAVSAAEVAFLQHRPAAARELLLGIGPNAGQRKLHALAMAVRAVAETYLDDPVQADGLTRPAAHDGCSPELLQMAEAVRAAAETGALSPLSRLPQLGITARG